MNQSGKNILVLSSDEDLDLGCSFQMKDSIYSDALNLTHSDGVDDAFVPPVKIGLDKDKITGEPAVSQTQRYGLYFNYIYFIVQLNVVLKQAMVIGNISLYLHFCKAPNMYIHFTAVPRCTEH